MCNYDWDRFQCAWFVFQGLVCCRARILGQSAAKDSVQSMTAEEIIAAARRSGKDPDAWLMDARRRGILKEEPGQ